MKDASVAMTLLIFNAALLTGFAFAAIAPNRQKAFRGHSQLIFYTALGISAFGVLFGGAMYAEAMYAEVSQVLANLAAAVFFVSLAWHLVLWLPDLRAVNWSPPLIIYSVAAGSAAAVSGIVASLIFLL
jgi:hypothetical protein